MKNKKGFTLIELLIVISIIGFLASIAMLAINNARAKSRDAKRIADIQTLQKAIELYYDEKKTYPSTSSYGENVQISGVCQGGWDCSHSDQNNDGEFFMPFLKNYISSIPVDPTSNNQRHYRYFYYGDTGTTAWGCMTPYYIILATGLETPAGKNDNICYTPYPGDYNYVVIGGQK